MGLLGSSIGAPGQVERLQGVAAGDRVWRRALGAGKNCRASGETAGAAGEPYQGSREAGEAAEIGGGHWGPEMGSGCQGNCGTVGETVGAAGELDQGSGTAGEAAARAGGAREGFWVLGGTVGLLRRLWGWGDWKLPGS